MGDTISQEVMETIEAGNSLIITGRAGVGKTALMRRMMDQSKRNMALLAPTGIAALTVGGQTIHSFFRLPPETLYEDKLGGNIGDVRDLYRALDCLLIDEISMVRADVLDAIDWRLRSVRRGDLPFGGLQVVFSGDAFQLPPVQKVHDPRYATPFFFSAEVMKDYRIPVAELTHIYRQNDPVFIGLLNAVRDASINQAGLDALNQRVDPTFDPPDGDRWLTLTTTNAMADKVNQDRLDRLPGEERVFTCRFSDEKAAEKEWPMPKELHLKEGAQIIFIRNDLKEHRYVNGSLGRITAIGKAGTGLEVELLDPAAPVRYIRVYKEMINQVRHVWDRHARRIVTETVAWAEQFPLKLAFGATIHKAQSGTFDRLIIDFGRHVFAAGQAYVALSRCRTLDGLVLRRPLRASDVRVDPRVVDFINGNRLQ